MSSWAAVLPEAGLARFLFDVAWQSTLAGLLALILLQVRYVRPAARAWIAMLAIALSIAAPIFTGLMRAGGYGWLPPGQDRAELNRAETARAENDRTSVAEADDAEPEEVMQPQEDGQLASTAAFTGEQHVPPASDARTIAGSIQSHFWTACIGIWAAATLVLLVRLLKDLASIERLRRQAGRCSDPAILNACRAAAKRLGLRAPPPVAYSSLVNCPTVLAWGMPLVFLPAPAASPGGGEPSALENESRWFAILCHELGHLRRRDGWAALAVELGVIALPWQPLMWLLRREFQRSCEEACDDWALFAGVDPADYAAALLHWVPRGVAPLSLGIRSSRLPIRRRLERILQTQGAASPSLGVAWALGGGSGAAGVAAVLAMFQAGSSPTLPANSAGVRFAAAAVGAAGRVDYLPASRGSDALTIVGQSPLRHWHDACVLGFAADGKAILSAGRDGMIQTWDATSGAAQNTLERPHAVAASSADGSLLFLSDGQGEIEVRDAVNGGVKHSFSVGPAGDEPCTLFDLHSSRDGALLACSGRYGGAEGKAQSWIAVWDVPSQTQRFLRVDEAESLTSSEAGWECLALSPDGRWLAAAALHSIACWDLASAKRVATLDADHSVYDLDFHPQRQWLASGDAGGIVRIWDLANGRTRLRLDHRMNTITAVAFHPVEEKLAVADGRTIRLWDANTGNAVWSQPLPGKQRFKGGVHFDEAGLRIAAAAEHRVALFDARSGDPLITGESAAAELTALAADGASELFFTGGANGEIAAWSFADGHRLRRWQAHAAAIDALVISRDGKTLASAAEDGSLLVWDVRSGAVRREFTGRAANRLAISPDGGLLAGLGPRQTLNLWDLEGGESDQQLPWREAGIWGPFVFSADGRFLFAADVTHRDVAVLWDIESRRIVRRWDEDARRFSSMQLAVTGDDRFLAMGVYGQRFAIWDIQGDHKIEIVDGHRGWLQSLAFSPSGALASTAEDGRVGLWSADTGELTAEIIVGPPRGRVRLVVFGDDGRRLATLNGNGTVSIVPSSVP